jgi:hypothetical protein
MGQISRTSGKRLTPGEAGCWLGHLLLLEHAAHLATTLILEDDVDWDVALKDQLKLIAPSIRALSESEVPDTVAVDVAYGTGWDILWLGHCGDVIPSSNVLSVHDISLPEDGIYVERDGRQTPFPKFERMMHWSVSPICTYAYAVTSHGVSRILDLIQQGVEAQISEQYQLWYHQGNLSCITVNPELFHHHQRAGSSLSQIDAIDGWNEISKVSQTVNIRSSARCQAENGPVCS